MSRRANSKTQAQAFAKTLAGVLVVLLAWPAATAEAQTRRTWSGAVSTLWSTGSNWFGNAAPSGSTDTIVFDSTGTYASGTAVAFTANPTVSGIVVTNPSADVVMSGTNSSFTINGTGIDMSGAEGNLSIFASGIVQMRSGTMNVAAGRTLTVNYTNAGLAAAFVNGTTTINGSGLVRYTPGLYVGRGASASQVTALNIVSGSFSSGGGLVIAGGSSSSVSVSNAAVSIAQVAVGGNSSFTQSSGTTTMSDFNNTTWVGNGSITINGGVFAQTGNWRGAVAVASNAGDNVTLTMAGGTTTLWQVPVTRGAGANFNVNFNGGVFRPGASSSNFFGSATNAANLYAGNNGALIDTNGFHVTFAQTIMNGTAAGAVGFLRKLGSGTLTLSASNSYTGDTQIASGVLSLASVNALAGSTLDMNSGDAGSLVFGVSGTNTYNFGGLIGSRNLAMSGSVNLSVGANSTSGTYSGTLSGAGAFAKVGSGALTLTGSNTFAGLTTISGGTLAIDGQVASGVAVAGGAFLGGSGSIGGVLSGAGIVSPGNSPGILTASQFNPSGGLGAAFEFTGATPVYGAPTASVNDVLRLTNATPFTASLSPANVIDIYLNVSSIGSGDVFEGGFFTGLSDAALLTEIQTAAFNFWIKDTNGSNPFGGVNYSPLTSVAGVTGMTVNTVSRTVNFGDGPVVGSVTQFIVVPEPGALTLAGVGLAAAGWTALRRRRRTS